MEIENKAFIFVVLLVAIFMYRQQTQMNEIETLKKLADDLVLTAKKLDLDVTALKKDTSDMTSVRTTVHRLDLVINDVSQKMRELTEKVSRMTQDNEETRRRLLQFRDEFTNLKHAFRDRNPIMDALNSFFDWITGSNRLRLN